MNMNHLMLIACLLTLTSYASSDKAKPSVSASEYNIRDFGAKGDGKNDDSKAIQNAIDEAYLSGGGIVFAGGTKHGWLLKKPILIRPNVTLKGIHAGPSDAEFLAAVDAGKAGEAYKAPPAISGSFLVDQSEYPAITLSHNSGIQGITIAYPDQVPFKEMPIKPYPPAMQIKGYDINENVPGINRANNIKTDGPISGRSVTIRDIGAINAYQILDIAGENPPIKYQVAQITIDGLWGYPLSVGVNIQNSLDTIMLHNVQFRPTFFGAACGEISKSSIGFLLGKSDGCAISDVLVYGLGIGILHKSVPDGYQAFSVRVSNANIEAVLPIWMDSIAIDDQIQYTNSFLFNTAFGFKVSEDDVYTRKGHTLFPDISYKANELSVIRISNKHEKQTFQSYARFTGCGFHAHGLGPICRVEGNQLVRVMMASSHMVYFKDSVLQVASGAKTLSIITGNDIMLHSTNLSSAAADDPNVHIVDIRNAGSETGVIFSDNMLHGVKPSLIDELKNQTNITLNGNHIP